MKKPTCLTDKPILWMPIRSNPCAARMPCFPLGQAMPHICYIKVYKSVHFPPA